MANFTRMSDDMLIDAIGLVVKMDDGTKRGRFGSYELKYEEHYVLRSQNTQSLLKFFIPDVKSFQAMNQPSSSDWLSYHKESEQTFYDFLASTHYTPDCVRHRIYIQPFSIDEEQVPPGILTAVQSYTNIFFGMDVEVLTPISLKGDVPERVNAYSRTLQVDALVVLSRLVKLVRKDAFCVAGITLCDLYPEEDWNFVFGVASCAARCGVHSLARYLDNFGMQKTSVFDNRGLIPTQMRVPYKGRPNHHQLSNPGTVTVGASILCPTISRFISSPQDQVWKLPMSCMAIVDNLKIMPQVIL
ncbi:archaemetzincin-2-like isoform X2 [Haliotis rufescens]|uniref:archaemetzincin-2-like isoform X2 n=1 Tax=Haliotis rufescens TaxID=6454 RepID=UPI00201F6A19|nr:archaemetzincin-2-like isoform X2 [Haliotis rufescens]